MKKILLIIALFLAISISVKAQGPTEDPAKKYGISYPIAALGNCQDYQSCRNYCEDETHRNACIQFAKEKGFYKEPVNDQILNQAKSEFGCSSETECKTFCEKEENFEKCSSFAQKTGLVKEKILSPKNQEIITKAKEILGCDSPQSCKSICEEEANRQKCSEFAKQTGLRGGEQRRGPGGCDSEQSCQSFCSNPDNFNECSKFKPPEGQGQPNRPQEEFKGPGGCNSEQSCRQYCEKNPAECQKFGPGPDQKGERPSGPPEGARREEMEKLCRENPERCRDKFGGNGPPENSLPEDRDKPHQSPPPNNDPTFKPPAFGEERPPETNPEHRPEGDNRPQENFQPPQQQQPQQPPVNQEQPVDQQSLPSNQNPPPEVKGASTVYYSLIKAILLFFFESP